MKKIALIPIYNEEGMVIHVLNALSSLIDIFILGNDGSTDSTKTLLKDWMNGRENVYLLSWEKRRGMSYTLKRGFFLVRSLVKEGLISTEDIVVTIDADGQHEANYIPGLIDYLERNKLNMVITRRDFEGYPKYRVLGNRLLAYNATLWGRVKFRDSECGFRIMKAETILKILPYYTGYRYSCAQEIAVLSGMLRLKINNDYPIKVPYYRFHTDLRDALINLILGIIAFLRVKLRLRSQA